MSETAARATAQGRLRKESQALATGGLGGLPVAFFFQGLETRNQGCAF